MTPEEKGAVYAPAQGAPMYPAVAVDGQNPSYPAYPPPPAAAYPQPPPLAGNAYVPGFAPRPGPPPGTPLQEWEHGLCGCFSDCKTCCWGFWCPCWLFGDNQERMGQTDCFIGCILYYLLATCCLQGCYASSNRKAIRNSYALQGSDCPACCAHTFCGGCAICQDAREIRYQQAKYVAMTAPPTMAPPQQAM